MSSTASWSYTAKATIWPLSGRDDWDGGQSFAAPVVIDCDYGSNSERLTDAKGDEFVSRLRIFTEYSGAKQGDRIAIGDHEAVTNPLTLADAAEVRLVRRYADTLERKADDFEVIT
jgi:hypothetical protein